MGLLDWMTDPNRTQQLQGLGNNFKGAIEKLKQQDGLLNAAVADSRKYGLLADTPAINAFNQSVMNGVVNGVAPLAIDPIAKPLWINQLATGEINGLLRIGDITNGQGKRARSLLNGKGPETNDVTIPDHRSSKVKGDRVDDEGYSPEFVGDVTEQGMRKSSDVDRDPASRNGISLVQRGMRDTETGRPYDARVPIKISSDGKSWELVSVVPDGLPPRKAKPPSR